jgi:hypothetical protein
MTNEEIIEMARQTNMDYLEHISEDSMNKVQAFVKLVAEHEREKCAKIADSWNKNVVWENKMLSSNIAKEIRSRGQQ